MNRQKFIMARGLLLVSFIAIMMVTGCATATLKYALQNDPWQGWNQNMQSFNDGLDKHILKPVANGYFDVAKGAVDDGVTHFFSNINDIGVFINDILQFKLLQGSKDISRFMVNTTVGFVGVFDVASKIDLPKHNEDFGQTLGVWQLPSGPYWVLPFFGPSTPRETLGLIGDALMDPISYVSIFGGFTGTGISAGVSALDVTDHRAGLMNQENIVDEASNGDRYEFIKSSYLQHREYLIYDGNPPDEDIDEDTHNTSKIPSVDSSVPPKPQ